MGTVSYLWNCWTKVTVDSNKLDLVMVMLHLLQKPTQLLIPDAKLWVLVTSCNIRMDLKAYTNTHPYPSNCREKSSQQQFEGNLTMSNNDNDTHTYTQMCTQDSYYPSDQLKMKNCHKIAMAKFRKRQWYKRNRVPMLLGMNFWGRKSKPEDQHLDLCAARLGFACQKFYQLHKFALDQIHCQHWRAHQAWLQGWAHPAAFHSHWTHTCIKASPPEWNILITRASNPFNCFLLLLLEPCAVECLVPAAFPTPLNPKPQEQTLWGQSQLSLRAGARFR